jgi:glycosyltransferase involved in cell wall biosynthesis
MVRLTVDLRFHGPTVASGPEERVITLRELAGMARKPWRLWRTLRDPRLAELSVLRDVRSLNGVQSGAIALASLSCAGNFEIRSSAGVRRMGRNSMRARAVIAVAATLPLELTLTACSYKHARKAAARSYALPSRPVGEIRRVTYLRAESSLSWLGAQVGGSATHTGGVINGLTKAGVEVNAFAAERLQGVREAHCEAVAPPHILQLVHWLTRIVYGHTLVSAAASVPADLVYQRYALGSCAGLELARRLDVPLVLEFNSSEIWTERNWGSGHVPLVKTLSALERRNLLDASLIVVVSRVLEDQLIDEGIDPARVLVNPNGVEIDELSRWRSHPPTHWRTHAGLPDVPTVGFVGTFGLWHGVTLLPEMIEQVVERRADARWVLIGDGPLHPQVVAEINRRGLSDRVWLTGVVAHPRAVELLACCDVCVSPHIPNPDGTPFFGSPTKLFEYMGLGRAIVASDLAQIGEVLEDGRTALLTTPGDGPAGASAIARLLDDGTLRARLGQAALEQAVERHSWDAHVERILDALRRTSDSANNVVLAGR